MPVCFSLNLKTVILTTADIIDIDRAHRPWLRLPSKPKHLSIERVESQIERPVQPMANAKPYADNLAYLRYRCYDQSTCECSPTGISALVLVIPASVLVRGSFPAQRGFSKGIPAGRRRLTTGCEWRLHGERNPKSCSHGCGKMELRVTSLERDAVTLRPESHYTTYEDSLEAVLQPYVASLAKVPRSCTELGKIGTSNLYRYRCTGCLWCTSQPVRGTHFLPRLQTKTCLFVFVLVPRIPRTFHV